MFIVEAVLKRTYDHALTFWRDYSPKGRGIARKRAETEEILDALARSVPHRFEGTVLIDSMWDNPNFWLRFSLLRAALGLAHGKEVGVLGEFKKRQCRRTLARFGVKTVETFSKLPEGIDVKKQAAALVAATRSAEDILEWKLPGGVHPAIIYDGILKRQRLAAVDVNDPQFERFVVAALTSLERARCLLDTHRFDLVVITHPFDFTYGAIAWLALARSIPVVLAFGLFGVLRLTRMEQPADLFRFYDRPTREEMDLLPQQKAASLSEVGRKYLTGRFDGRANDLAAVYAFGRSSGAIDRAALCAKFGWNPQKPIVGFYGSNWYDWPHQLGMTQFRDFLDWTNASFEAACVNDQVNWLFKPHPCEEWFGGIGLADILAKHGGADHIAIADKSWNNAHVMQAIDALVTYHGTAGVEFASLGKPVLVPDRGKYDDCGFVKVAQSRAHYLDLLSCEWWQDMDLADTKKRAEIFAGWWFCAPEWQDRFILSDDSRQDELYDVIPALLRDNGLVVEREIQSIREWWQSRHPYYHTSKMMQADHFRLTNIA